MLLQNLVISANQILGSFLDPLVIHLQLLMRYVCYGKVTLMIDHIIDFRGEDYIDPPA